MSVSLLSLKNQFPFIIRITGLFSVITLVLLFYFLPRFATEILEQEFNQIIIEQIDIPQTQQIRVYPYLMYKREIMKHTMNLVHIITFQNLLVDAKMQIVKKLNSVKQLTDTFIKTSNGFKVTNPEGFVAIDRISGGAVKLVDRMEFSFNNFTAIKAWDK